MWPIPQPSWVGQYPAHLTPCHCHVGPACSSPGSPALLPFTRIVFARRSPPGSRTAGGTLASATPLFTTDTWAPHKLCPTCHIMLTDPSILRSPRKSTTRTTSAPPPLPVLPTPHFPDPNSKPPQTPASFPNYPSLSSHAVLRFRGAPTRFHAPVGFLLLPADLVAAASSPASVLMR